MTEGQTMTAEIDFCYIEGEETLDQALAAFRARWGVEASVVEHFGQAGDWLVVRVSGSEDKMKTVMCDYNAVAYHDSPKTQSL